MSVSTPLFSILIANYNNGLFLENCIKSIISQSYQNIEIVCLDDGSCDHSLEILQRLANTYPTIKFFQNQRNEGCGYTKHKLCELAEGDILAFVDPEDTIVSDAVKIMVEQHQKYPNCSLVYSTHYICDKDLVPSGVSSYTQAIPENTTLLDYKDGCISHFATFKKKFYFNTIGIDPVLRKAIDQDLYYKLEEVGLVKFVDLPLYYYRIHEGGISTGVNSKSAYLWHLRAKIAAFKRRSQKGQYFRHKAILSKLQHRYFRMFRYAVAYFIKKI